jgi:hypothetical protein
MEVSHQLHTPAALPPKETAISTHYIDGWVGPKDGLDIMEKRKISWTYKELKPDTWVIQLIA